MPISRGKKQANPFDSDSDSETSKPAARSSLVPNFQNQSVQELETYAVNKSKETTDKVNDCLKIAEVIREDANRTLVTLHQQGEQIHRTHQQAADIDHDLSRSEKLLNSLGGLFSKPWKPKKTREIKGPAESMIEKGEPQGTEREIRVGFWSTFKPAQVYRSLWCYGNYPG